MCGKSSTLTKWWQTKTVVTPVGGRLSLPSAMRSDRHSNYFRLTLFTLCLLLSATTVAQVHQSVRYEVILKHDEPGFDVTTAADNGLFLTRLLSGGEADRLELVRLDTALQEIWKGFIPVEHRTALAGKMARENYVFFLLRHVDPSMKDLQLFAVNSENGNYTKYAIKSYIHFSIAELQVTREAVLIGGYFNKIPLVLYFNLALRQSRILPGLFNEEGELTQIHPHADGTFDVLIASKNFYRQQTIWIKNYAADGTLIGNYALTPEDNKNLIFGRSVKTSGNMQIIAGVYGGKNSQYSRGLFVGTIDPAGLQHTKYYSFGDLENFFKYMKAKRETRIKERIQRRKVKGKKTRFNYRFLVHEVIEYNEQYILLGEAFYPRYKSLDNTYYGSFFRATPGPGNAIIRDGRIFDGYWYTHAVIMAFDKEGTLLWDNSFEINDVKSFTLEQFVKLEAHEDKIILLYLFENTLRTKIIQGSKVLEGKAADPIKTRFKDDIPVPENTASGKLDYWYDGYFYAYGVQDIVNIKELQTLPRRKVFFINKITYR